MPYININLNSESLNFSLSLDAIRKFNNYKEESEIIHINIEDQNFPLTTEEINNGMHYLIDYLETKFINLTVIYDIIIMAHITEINRQSYDNLFVYMCNEINKLNIFWLYEDGEVITTYTKNKKLFDTLIRLHHRVEHNLNNRNTILFSVFKSKANGNKLIIEQKTYINGNYMTYVNFDGILNTIIYNRKYLLTHKKYKYIMCLFKNIPYIDIKKALTEKQLSFMLEYLAFKKLSFMNENFYHILSKKVNTIFVKKQIAKFNLDKMSNLDYNLLDTLQTLEKYI